MFGLTLAYFDLESGNLADWQNNGYKPNKINITNKWPSINPEDFKDIHFQGTN